MCQPFTDLARKHFGEHVKGGVADKPQELVPLSIGHDQFEPMSRSPAKQSPTDNVIEHDDLVCSMSCQNLTVVNLSRQQRGERLRHRPPQTIGLRVRKA
jgi:hypothetical protein